VGKHRPECDVRVLVPLNLMMEDSGASLSLSFFPSTSQRQFVIIFYFLESGGDESLENEASTEVDAILFEFGR